MKNKVLTTKKELEIYMNPCRQEILREMGKKGEPVTPKYLSDCLGVSASSIQFHLRKLESLGVVELHHTELVRGITARYFCVSDVNVSIGANREDNREEREVLLENCVKNVFEGCRKALRRVIGKPVKKAEDAKNGDILTGVAFLSDEDARVLYQRIHEFLDGHSKKQAGTHAWEYALLAYPMEEEEKRSEE